MLGIIAQQEGKSELALQWIDAALTAKPDLLPARFNRSVVLRALRAQRRGPAVHQKNAGNRAGFCGSVGYCRTNSERRRRLCRSRQMLRPCFGLTARQCAFSRQLRFAAVCARRFAAAYKEARKAESLDPSYPPMLLGNILRSWGHPEEAAACFARVRSLLPHFADAYASEAMARLQMGDMEEGFSLWERRPDLSSDHSKVPLWQGQKVSALMLYEDQGLGRCAFSFCVTFPCLKNARII